jgi:hypothetical protein
MTATKVFIYEPKVLGHRLGEYRAIMDVIKCYLRRAHLVCNRPAEAHVVSDTQEILDTVRDIPQVSATAIFLSDGLEQARALCEPFGVKQFKNRRVVLLAGSASAGIQMVDGVIVLSNAQFHQDTFLNIVV